MPKIKKSNHEKNFTQIFNQLIDDPRLSWKARGIFLYLFRLPPDWNFHESELKYHSWSDGLKSLSNGIKELRHYKYLTIKKERNSQGKLVKNGTIWYLDDKPDNYYKQDINNAKRGIFPLEWEGHLTSFNGHEVKFLSERGASLTPPKGHEVKSPSYKQPIHMSVSVGQANRHRGKGQSTNTVSVPILKQHQYSKSGRKSKSARKHFVDTKVMSQQESRVDYQLMTSFPKYFTSSRRKRRLVYMMHTWLRKYPSQLVMDAVGDTEMKDASMHPIIYPLNFIAKVLKERYSEQKHADLIARQKKEKISAEKKAKEQADNRQEAKLAWMASHPDEVAKIQTAREVAQLKKKGQL